MDNLLIILFFIILLLIKQWSPFTENVSDVLTYTETSSDAYTKKKIKLITNPDKDIKLQPLGCFYNLDEKFFYKKINPFAKIKEFNSLFVVQNDSDFSNLIEEVKNNGFSNYIDTLDKNYNNLTLQQLAVLGVFAGYNYISLYKKNESEYGKIYLSYSPPMDRHNIYGNFTQKEYNQSLLKPDLPKEALVKECGFSCKDPGYMCGSANHPNIKNTPRFAVYQMVESV
jgi:hypothetical protein